MNWHWAQDFSSGYHQNIFHFKCRVSFHSAPKSRWQLIRLQNAHNGNVFAKENLFPNNILEVNRIFPISLHVCSFKCITNEVFSDHIFSSVQTALQITCWARASCRERSDKMKSRFSQKLEAPEQEDVRLRLVQHVVDPPSED